MSPDAVDRYGWASAEAPHSCRYIFPKVHALLKEFGIRRVLDVGAGNGMLCSELAGAGFAAVGIEQDKEGVQIARSNHPDVHFYQYGVQDDPALLLKDEEPFDGVVSTEVVEHLFFPHLLPAYAHAILKNGGYLIVSSPYHGYLKNVAISVLNKWDAHHGPLWTGGHIKFWSRATLTRLFQENGFDVIAFSGMGRWPYLWKSMVLSGRKRG